MWTEPGKPCLSIGLIKKMKYTDQIKIRFCDTGDNSLLLSALQMFPWSYIGKQARARAFTVIDKPMSGSITWALES